MIWNIHDLRSSLFSSVRACLMPLLALSILCTQVDVRGSERKPWEYAPYEIEVWLHSGAGEFTASLRDSIAQFLVQRADVVAGATWNLSVTEPPEPLRGHLMVDFAGVSVDEIVSNARPSLLKDKIILACVQIDDYEFIVRAREMDCRTRMLGPVITQKFRQPAHLPFGCFDAIADAFLPVVRIEDVKGRQATVRIRAGGLFYGEPSPALIKVGDVLQPIIRTNDRAGEPRPNGIVAVPWTYLYLTSEERTTQTCQVHSGRRGGIGGRTTSRVERYGRLVRVLSDASDIQVRTMGKDPRPLVGYEVYSKDPEVERSELGKEAEQQTPAELLGRTDWRGILRIPKGERALRVLYIKSGGQLLARLPVVPGADSLFQADVPPDDRRLQAEGYVKGIQAQVMENVSRKHLFAARIRKKITEKQLEQAQTLLDELRAMPTKEQLLQILSSQQNKLTDPDQNVKVRIDKLFGDARNLVIEYIDQNIAEQLSRELTQARQAG